MCRSGPNEPPNKLYSLIAQQWNQTDKSVLVVLFDGYVKQANLRFMKL